MRKIVFVEVNTYEVARFKAIMSALCLTFTEIGYGDQTNSTIVFKCCLVPPWTLHVRMDDDPNMITAVRFADGIVYLNTFDIREIPKAN